jgi:hypothetical protein
MPLILQPTFDVKTRQEIEAHIEQVRARRLAASMAYHAGVQQKLSHESDVIQRRIKQQYEMLCKELIRLEKLEDSIQTRLNKLDAMHQELGVVNEMLDGAISNA